MPPTAAQPARQTFLEDLARLSAESQPLPALNVDEIDSCCLQYELASRAYETALAQLSVCKQAMVALVQAHGNVPPGAEESKRLFGRRSIATITTGKTTTVREEGVLLLENYLDEHGLTSLFHELFAVNTTHKVQKSAHDALRATKLRKPEDEKIKALFGSCIDVKPKAPSLKVESITPEKPERKPRGRKVAA